MSGVLIVGERALRACVHLDAELVDVIERAFAALAGGAVVMPPVLHMELPACNGEVDVKTAWVPGLGSFAVKISPGFFDNPALGLASLNGLMVLLGARTGVVEAVLLDNGYLTDLRTAAAGAVAARHLAPREVRTAAVLGAGVQARLQVQAAHLVRPFRRVCVWARDAARARACAVDLAGRLELEAHVCASPHEAVSQAQLVVTATASRRPLLEAASLHPGLHVTAVGADAPGKNELHPEVLARAGRLVADRRSQSERIGELRAALACGVLDARAEEVVELGQVVAGELPGRLDEAQITVCDLTGTGVQDTAIATLAARRAAAAGLGSRFEP